MRISIGRTKRLRGRRAALLLGRLEAYASAGLPIGDALKGSLSDQLVQEAASGRPLSACLGAAGLSSSLVGILRCGERGGSLPESLRACRIAVERRDDAIRRCGAALAYPVVIGIAASGLALGVMEGIVPQIEPLLSGMHTELPQLTKAVVWASRFIGAWWPHIVFASFAAVVCASALYARSLRIRWTAHRAVMSLPFVRSAAIGYSLAGFLRSVGYMMSAGAGPIEASRDALDSVWLTPLRDRLASRLEPIERGKPFSSIIEAGMPGYVGSLLATGEASGRLGASCISAADMIDGDIAASIGRAGALLEPAMMAGMGSMVGAIALAIMAPIYELSRSLQPS